MCGICGKLNLDGRGVSKALVKAMADTIEHRGPDDEGYYVSGPVGLGFRRLSIIDLQSGHQPLSNEDDTVWIAFNGEIYNYQELRDLLLSRGHVFKTKTDTEVIVHLYEEYGPECLQKLRGMFGFAIWDGNTKTFLLARDRLGIKPMYYSLTSTSLVFGSEMKAILADPSIQREMSPELIDRFLTFMYMPGEDTLLKGIQKLAPGHYLLVKNGNPVIRQYWDLQFQETRRNMSLHQAKDELLELLKTTVKQHMIADVPVGVLLSGGIDSTGVLGLAVDETSKPMSSFTVGFDGQGVADERPYARLAAEKFGTQHYDMTITAKDFADFLPQYVWHMEEPVCEPPAIAMYYVSKLARQYVTVLLSGEGGDEAFAGYGNYRNLVWLERAKRMIGPLSGPLARGISLADSLFHLPRAAKYVDLMKDHFPDYYYSRTSNPYRQSANRLSAFYSPELAPSIFHEYSLEPVRRLQAHVRGQNTLDAMLYIDTKTWLPDDLLIKADKMTMANSIELRVPLLDHQVLEFAASLPPSFKLKGFSLKHILKEALSHKIPQEIRNRKKTGFPVPYASWLRGDLQHFVRDVLTDSRTINRRYFRREAVEGLLQDNQSGADRSKEIFSLLSLELWQRAFLESRQAVLHS
jgi:asparagine synthase (glutamine-hydrolysing)